MASRSPRPLEHMVDGGYLLAPTFAIPHSLIIVMENGDILVEVVPLPHPYEQASFVPFLLRGLGFSVHPFFCGLLHFYCLQL